MAMTFQVNFDNTNSNNALNRLYIRVNAWIKRARVMCLTQKNQMNFFYQWPDEHTTGFIKHYSDYDIWTVAEFYLTDEFLKTSSEPLTFHITVYDVNGDMDSDTVQYQFTSKYGGPVRNLLVNGYNYTDFGTKWHGTNTFICHKAHLSWICPPPSQTNNSWSTDRVQYRIHVQKYGSSSSSMPIKVNATGIFHSYDIPPETLKSWCTKTTAYGNYAPCSVYIDAQDLDWTSYISDESNELVLYYGTPVGNGVHYYDSNGVFVPCDAYRLNSQNVFEKLEVYRYTNGVFVPCGTA